MYISKELTDKVKSLYEQAVVKYKESTRPANYIPGWINKRLEQKLSIEQIYCIVNNIENKPKCAVCGKDCRFINLTWGYRKTCGNPKCIGQTSGLKTKNKTYSEIYGQRKVKCGFQKGENNIAKRPEIREKISIAVKKSYEDEHLINKRRQRLLKRPILTRNKTVSDSYGNLYRSKLEAAFSNFLIENNIPFKYEIPIKMNNGHHKIVDFVLYDKVMVEITGYSYPGWQKDFNEKIFIFQRSIDIYDKVIYILTYKNKLDLLINNLLSGFQATDSNFCKKKLENTNIFFNKIEVEDGNIINKDEIMKDIHFIKSIVLGNRYLKQCGII